MNSPLALITGASRGLGAHLACRFWYAGWSLILVARDKKALVDKCASFENRSFQTLELVSCDLASNDQIKNFSCSMKEKYQSLDLLVNNAAIQGPIGSLQQNDFDEWIEALQINLLAPVLLCKELIPLLNQALNPSIINLSGGGATGPRPGFSSYSSSKAALVRFSETIANELRPQNINVNCIAPGALKTNMLEKILASPLNAGERELELANKVFTDGGACMDRVADLILFLAGNAGRGITGKLISVTWDNWEEWPNHISELDNTDLFTLRRIVGRDRNIDWGDR
ncbi:SDR family oxidoreductase [Polynucleobacter sp. MWH-UH24A]|uniref:SDR family oxidoreductase n=1 Tax=Polynucleobacter sp. MWH-UH24A TaxID=2689110 RepID=UPI001BFE049B|nr:SDR family oxidoreductase [Polynucleobacter sp. MWH-UH24A]QWD76413.1 SDR family oxidoreductase [Polynucleobacter sp. MWH-UH24A]